MRTLRPLAFSLLLAELAVGLAQAQSWQAIANLPPIPYLSTSLLLRDGRVMVDQPNTGNWAILTPDSTGNYVNGTWSMAASMPEGYGPYYFASAVLPDGRVLVEGGEYNMGVQDRTKLGAIYDPAKDSWTPVNPPAGWEHVGDAASTVLPNGTYMQANCCTNQVALFNEKNLTWTATGSTLTQNNNEMGWALLPNGTVLEVNTEAACGNNMSSELYDPGTGTWSCGPELPQQLWGGDNEMGTTVVMYNNKVIQFGGLISATAILDLASNTWSIGPMPPNGLSQDDSPSALEPNGKVLAVLFPRGFPKGGCQFMEYDPDQDTLTNTVNPPECPDNSTGIPTRLLMLPTGQILYTNFERVARVFTPSPGVASAAVPTIYPPVGILKSGSANNVLYGKQLNGLSQVNMYGDDAQQATNYPLIQLQDVRTGIVWWAKTHDDSSSGIAPNQMGFTKFDLDSKMPGGAFDMTVVTNGIRSNTIRVNVISNHPGE